MEGFARFFGTPPPTALMWITLAQRKLSPESVSGFALAIRLFYCVILSRPYSKGQFPRPRRASKLLVALCAQSALLIKFSSPLEA